MSYDISLHDPVTREGLCADSPHDMAACERRSRERGRITDGKAADE